MKALYGNTQCILAQPIVPPGLRLRLGLRLMCKLRLRHTLRVRAWKYCYWETRRTSLDGVVSTMHASLMVSCPPHMSTESLANNLDGLAICRSLNISLTLSLTLALEQASTGIVLS